MEAYPTDVSPRVPARLKREGSGLERERESKSLNLGGKAFGSLSELTPSCLFLDETAEGPHMPHLGGGWEVVGAEPLSFDKKASKVTAEMR